LNAVDELQAGVTYDNGVRVLLKATDAIRAYCRANRLCFKCRRPGHTASTPNAPCANGAPRTLNNVADNDHGAADPFADLFDFSHLQSAAEQQGFQ
jgi:hypothetical protein